MCPVLTGLPHRIHIIIFYQPKELLCVFCLHGIICELVIGWVCTHPLHPLLTSASVVFSIAKLTPRAPEAPSVQANLYSATSKDHYASETAPGGKSSWCSLWRRGSHLGYLLQPLCKKCDAIVSVWQWCFNFGCFGCCTRDLSLCKNERNGPAWEWKQKQINNTVILSKWDSTREQQ